ncbi:tyrosine-type recombinase/integrase [Herminiimonas arsenitoxidans]|uniref:tyrosine-type recombinase/integrase n=1 Tax=Herminiimonas arsenitoxidans TaxID=1809410 RepID=UPI000970299E|nr:tyrosine-type recombinase/integrase [Herminiimonas arsenitoxidans]
MDIYYLKQDRTPHLAHLIEQLGLVDQQPFTIDINWQCDAVLNSFLRSLAAPGSPSPNTWRTYAEQLSLFFRFLIRREKTWRNASSEDWLVYYRLRRIQSGPLKISSASWNVFAAALRRFYEWAQQEGHVECVPFEYTTKMLAGPYLNQTSHTPSTNLKERSRNKDIKYMTEHDFLEIYLPRIMATKEGLRNALYVRLLFRTGLRAEEAVTIKLSMLPDPDSIFFNGLNTCPLTVLGKGNKERTVRVPKSWLRDVRRYIEWDRADAIKRRKACLIKGNTDIKDEDFLFLTSLGRPATYSAFYKMMRVAGDVSGFSFKTHPHMLRHSYAIYTLSGMIRQMLTRQTVPVNSRSEAYKRMVYDPLRVLSRLMGHACVTTTFIYLDYVDEITDMIDISSDCEGFEIDERSLSGESS